VFYSLIAATFPVEVVDYIYAIAYCESAGFRASVVYGPETGSLGERGLMQLHPIHAWRFERRGWTWDDAFDPAKNLAIARELYDEQGVRPWACR